MSLPTKWCGTGNHFPLATNFRPGSRKCLGCEEQIRKRRMGSDGVQLEKPYVPITTEHWANPDRPGDLRGIDIDRIHYKRGLVASNKRKG